MDAPRRDMELLSNSLAAYAHIRGEGGREMYPALPLSKAPLHPFPLTLAVITPSPTASHLQLITPIPHCPPWPDGGYLMSFK